MARTSSLPTDGEPGLLVQGSKLLSNAYQGEEAAMLEAYVSAKGGREKIDSLSAYFFAIAEDIKVENGLLGKMPMTQQFGFLYVGNGSDNMEARTVAHEIGHGAYHLEHTFQEVYLGSSSQGNTDNLMDYARGIALWKYQWDIAHDPGHVWGVLKRDRDEENKIGVKSNSFIADLLESIRAANLYNNDAAFIGKPRKMVKIYELLRFHDLLGVAKVQGDEMTIDNKVYAKIIVLLPKMNLIEPTKIFKYSSSQGNIVGKRVGVTDGADINNAKIEITGYLKDQIDFSTEILKTDLGQSYIYNYLSLNQTNTNYGSLALFVNGYRNNLDYEDIKEDYDWLNKSNVTLGEYENSNNQVYYNMDFTNYWNGLDKKFLSRLQPANTNNVVYADGHMKITTANHRANNGEIWTSKMKFAESLITSSCALDNEMAQKTKNFNISVKSCLDPTFNNPEKPSLHCLPIIAAWNQLSNNVKLVIQGCESYKGDQSKVKLNTVPNLEGYNLRFENGKIAGTNLVKKLDNYEIATGRDDKVTLDVIAHSMGFAYSMGMIEVLRKSTKIKLGRYYILAPENASSSAIDVKTLGFEEVWQYGSDERPTGDKKYEQDGIAPQTPVTGLDWKAKDNRYGRVPFQGAQAHKNFLEAHYSSSYHWILDGVLKADNNGYVKKR